MQPDQENLEIEGKMLMVCQRCSPPSTRDYSSKKGGAMIDEEMATERWENDGGRL